jgi:four helix bundle protein
MSRLDLEERLLNYAYRVFVLASRTKNDSQLSILTKQLLRSASSVGANYAEGLETEYYKEKVHRLNICQRELKECDFWIKLLKRVKPEFNLSLLLKERTELRSIISAIIRNTKEKVKSKGG